MGCSPQRCLALITQLSGSTARGAIGDILLIVRSVPLSHVWPRCRREREDLRILVSPTSVLLCNSLMQRQSMSVTHRMRKWVPSAPPPKFKLPYNGGSETQGHFKPDVAQVGRCAVRLSKARQPSKKPTSLTDVKVILLAKPRTPIGVTGDSKNKVQCDDRDHGPVGTLAGAQYWHKRLWGTWDHTACETATVRRCSGSCLCRVSPSRIWASPDERSEKRCATCGSLENVLSLFCRDGSFARKCELRASLLTQSRWLHLLIGPHGSAWPECSSGFYQVWLKSTQTAPHPPAPSPASEVAEKLRPVSAVHDMLICILSEGYMRRPGQLLRTMTQACRSISLWFKQGNKASVCPVSLFQS